MKDAKYGVFLDYYTPRDPHDLESSVNAFDVEAVANQVNDAGADYVLFPVGQNSGSYCSPNATYDGYLEMEPGEHCSKRDLPDELADALAQYDIKMILYMTARAPASYSYARDKLGDIDGTHAPPQEFALKWNEVIREWSLRYKEKLAGWWFDGIHPHHTPAHDDLTKPANWNTWAEAARAGNPDRLLTFNIGQGLHLAFQRPTPQQDYAAGEMNEWGATPKENPTPEGMQWHILSYMGDFWGKRGGPYKSDEWMIDYIKTVNQQGGVVTIDVSPNLDGTIYAPHLKQLIAIGKGLRETSKPERD